MCDRFIRCFCLPILVVASLVNAEATDTVVSENGEILKGKVISETDKAILFETPFLGKVEILKSRIASLEREEIPELPESVDNSPADPIPEETVVTVEEPVSFPPEPFDFSEYERRVEEVRAPMWSENDDLYDWIQLKSGEWLKGSVEAMYSNKLEFDSDKLNSMTFDWEDIRRVRTAQEISIRVDKDTTRTGKIAMKDEVISISDGSSETVDQFNLISLAPYGSSSFNDWSGKITFSSTIRTGTVEQREGAVRAVLQNRTSQRKYYMDFLANYRSADEIVTSNDYRLNAYVDTFRTKKIFIRPVSIEWYRDPIQNLKNRYTLGASLGYHIKNNRKTIWDVTLGPAYQITEYSNIAEGEPRREKDPAVTFGSNFETKISDRLDAEGTYRIQYANSAGGFSFHTITTLEFELTNSIDIDLSLVWDRIENPIVDEDGISPSQDDVRTTVGIGVEF